VGNSTGGAAPVRTKLTYILERANDGFYFEVKDSSGGTVKARTRITGNADLVQRVEQEKMYWGFFAAREARILVENIVLEDQGPAVITPTTPPYNSNVFPAPAVALRSRTNTGTADYVLTLRPNYSGQMEVVRASTTLFDGPVVNGVEKNIPVVLSSGPNVFDYVFSPDDETAPPSGPVTGSYTITLTSSSSLTTVYAAPAASGTGNGNNAANPMALNDAITNAQPGQTIYLIAENYSSTTISFNATNSGISGKLITVAPAPGVAVPLRVRNIILNGYYVHVKDFIAGGTSATSRYNGIPISVNGDYNTVERCIAEYANNTGINTGGSSSYYNPNQWPKYNTFLNCTSRYNVDDDAADADGFGAKDVGPGNTYIGCVAYGNADDGWDLFNRVANGPSLPVTIINCVAYDHNANGFKLGGETQPVDHIIRDSIAYDNGMAGFSDNFNPGHIYVMNCVSIDNGTQNFILRDNTIITPTNEVKDSVSYRTAAKQNQGQADSISGTVENTFLTDASGVSKRDNRILSDSDFESLDRSYAYSRAADGTLVRGDFGKLKTP
jgi:hypothetical protein